jgi:hypothetical protein
MKKADNFDAKQWLVENKVTFQSRLNEEEFNLDTYFQKANKEYHWNFRENYTMDMMMKAAEDGEMESWEVSFIKKIKNIGEIPYENWKIKADKIYHEELESWEDSFV